MDELLSRFDKLMPSKRRCYTGRLDPMASGLIIVLTDDDVMKKMVFCDFSKIYTFTLLHGFTTDTHDIMGMVTNTNVEHQRISPGEYLMQYPPFSNYNIKGKPYWYYTKNNITPPFIPSKQVTVLFVGECGKVEITSENLSKLIKKKINKVSQNTFRQSEIKEKWDKVIEKDRTYYATKFIIGLTSGGFVRYFGNKMNGTCYDIKRMCYCF